MCKPEAVKKEVLFKGYGPKRKQKLRKLKKSDQERKDSLKQPMQLRGNRPEPASRANGMGEES